MDELTLEVQERTETGTGPNRRLRKAGLEIRRTRKRYGRITFLEFIDGRGEMVFNTLDWNEARQFVDTLKELNEE